MLSGKKESIGLHRSFPNYFEVGADSNLNIDQGNFTHDQLVSDQFEGLFLWENERVAVEVLARDNRWLRVGPGQNRSFLGYDEDPAKEVAQLLQKDPRASFDSPKPPYFPVIDVNENMDQFHPGISWWIEELPSGEDGSSEDQFQRRNQNQPFIVFRFPNYPPESVAGSDKDIRIFLRIVVRDLFSNVVDVRVPIFVRGKDFNISTLNRSSSRGGNK